MKHFVIYVPGLGDKRLYAGVQHVSLRLWRMSHVRAYYFLAHWAHSSETYKTKYHRLLKVIDDAIAEGHTVSLVGTSAGASLVLTAFAARKQKIHSVVTICGKLHNPGTVSQALFAMNPAFKESMAAYARIEHTLTPTDRKKILLARAARDAYVPASDGEVAGARTYIMPSAGHVFSVLMALTVFSRRILRFIKKRA